ncbi:MAG: DUF6076 domain-containing protein, partial [Oscillospiraceae bacterium]
MSSFCLCLKNGVEYIGTLQEGYLARKEGSLLAAFLDVDWLSLGQECAALRAKKLKRMGLSIETSKLYHRIVCQFAPIHPVLSQFAQEYLHDLAYDVLQDEYDLPQPTSELLKTREWNYLVHLGKCAEIEPIPDRLPDLWLERMAIRFFEIAALQKDLITMMDFVFHPKACYEKCSLMERYYFLREQSTRYSYYERTLYTTMSTEFRITLHGEESADLFPELELSEEKIEELKSEQHIKEVKQKKLSAFTFQCTPQIEALALWEFDDLIANDLRMRRCDYCGRYFIPYSAANCYCDRPVEGSAGKTCKEVGTATKHQEEVNGNAAKTLYRKVNNRTQQAAKRYEP